jgi:GntR family transcriptional regulator
MDVPLMVRVAVLLPIHADVMLAPGANRFTQLPLAAALDSSDMVIYITAMRIFVSPADDLPLYRQIMRQVMDAIAGGRLVAGERLMSHRELSERLAIAPLTVKKAYDELEALGFVESQRGRGTFVTTKPPKVPRSVVSDQLAEGARALLASAYLAGMQYSDVVEALEAADRDLTHSLPTHQRKKRPV